MECEKPFVTCSNSTNHSRPYITNLEYSIRITLLVICVMLIFLANSSILYVIIWGRRVPWNTRTIMASMCITDLLVGGIFVTSLVSAVLDRWVFGHELCVLIGHLQQVLFSITTCSCQVLLLDKYVAIEFPLKYNKIMSRRKIVCIIVLVWVVMGTLMPLLSMDTSGATIVTYYPEIYTCFVLYVSEDASRFSLCVIMPVWIVLIIGSHVICNTRIYIIIRRHQRKIGIAGSSGDQQKNSKGLLTIICTTSVLYLCWTPILLVRLLPLLMNLRVPHLVVFLAMIAMFSNSFANWIIYSKTLPAYKQDQSRLFNDLLRKDRTMRQINLN